MKILFVLRYREAPYEDCEGWTYSRTGTPLSSGLSNSAKMMVEMLHDVLGHETKLVHVNDGNDIHRECVQFGADLCVIEAFWVPPYKFDDLYQVMPDMKFIVRNHSETPFLANEGIAFGWMLEYLAKPNVYMAPNAPRMHADTLVLAKTAKLNIDKILYLPNFYVFDHKEPRYRHHLPTSDYLHVGCFGAIRPLKNTMEQAIAALAFARKRGQVLYFHINGTRVEGGADPILKNLRQTFLHLEGGHRLIEHEWTSIAIFKWTLSKMDLVMQCSFSETFNIVGADATDVGVPVVASKEIPWVTGMCQANPTSSISIVEAMERAMKFGGLPAVVLNRNNIKRYNRDSVNQWSYTLRKLFQ